MKKTGLRMNAILRGGRGDARGHIAGMPVADEVEVLMDGNGIPHIFAKSEDDLYIAQGFLHAQDRLWQMETLRRLAVARLSEAAGEAMYDLDHFSLLAGFGRMQRRAVANASAKERRILEAYLKGINAYIRWTGNDLPIEFRTLKIVPGEWRLEDLCGVLPFTSWSLQTNYEQELLAVLARERLDAELFNELYPVSREAKLPREPFFERFRDVRIAPLLPAAFVFFPQLAARARHLQNAEESVFASPFGAQAGSAVSNCWVVARGADGAPLLANDPHLGMMVPQVWHLCHLHCPTVNVCGVSMLGNPGIILGRNERVAWGVTNVMSDVVDLYIVRVDKGNPTRYYVGEEPHEMTTERVVIPIAGKEPREVVIYRTIHGTVLSRIEEGSEAVVVLKWYGTLPDEAIEDRTIGCFLALQSAKNVDEALEAGGLMKTAGQNLTVADVEGNIGWKATGLVPIRTGYSGRVPADGSDPAVGWDGFLPYDTMPTVKNPPSGRIATANNKTISDDFVHPITYSWLAPYRHDRIVTLLDQSDGHTVESLAQVQLDTHSLQGERLLPGLLAFPFDDPDAKRAIEILRGWDLQVVPESQGAAVFSVFLTELRLILSAPLLGEALPLFLAVAGFFHSPVDHLLTGGSADRLLEAAGFSGETALVEACQEALSRAITFLTAVLGGDTRRWKWGNLHTHLFLHPGANGGASSWLLNRGPYPAYGDSTTVNVSAFDPAQNAGAFVRYRSVTVPSMRLVTSLADVDSTVIMAPMGQSGKPGNRHYDDMIGRWIRGGRVPLPLSRAGVERVAKKRIVLGR